jgi:hypothetical protein
MSIRGWELLLCIAAAFAVCSSSFCRSLPSTDDILPRSDPAYDYLATLQPAPGPLRLRPLTKAEWVAALAEIPEPVDNSIRSAFSYAARWRAGLIEKLPPETVGGTVLLTGRVFPERSPLRTALGSYRATGFAGLGEHALLEVVLSDRQRLEGEKPSAFEVLELARVQARYGKFQLEAGQGSLRWDSSVSGGVLVSDAAPPVSYAKIGFPLQLPLVGQWQFEQFYSQFRESGETHYWGARRVSKSLNDRLTLTLQEAFKAMDLPGGLLSQFLPYYWYQKIMSTGVRRQSGWFNYLAGLGLEYRLPSEDELYLFAIADDLQGPDFWGGRNSTRRKLAVVAGARLYPSQGVRLILEGVFTDGTPDGGTYGPSIHASDYAYFYRGLPLGHTIGSNRRGVYARLEAERGCWWLAFEGFASARTTTDTDALRGNRLNAEIGYQVTNEGLLLLRYRTHNERTGSLTDHRSGWWLEWNQRF